MNNFLNDFSLGGFLYVSLFSIILRQFVSILLIKCGNICLSSIIQFLCAVYLLLQLKVSKVSIHLLSAVAAENVLHPYNKAVHNYFLWLRVLFYIITSMNSSLPDVRCSDTTQCYYIVVDLVHANALN